MRDVISAADLFVLLDREFEKRRPSECRKCKVSLPFRVVPAPGGPNWDALTTNGGCPFGCDAIFEEIVAKYKAAYDLKA